MATDSLVGPFRKLDRADAHIKELDEIIKGLLDSHKGTVSVEADVNPEWLLCVANEPFDLPDRLPLVVGDAIHNLHSAWDHLAVLLVNPPASMMWKVQFPFARTAAKVEEEIDKRGFLRCDTEVLDAIRDLRPYRDNGGNEQFFALHKLDIQDKHRLILTVAHLEALPWVAIRYGPQGGMMASMTPFGTENGREVCRIPATSNVKIGDHLNPGLGVLFGQGIPLAGKPIPKTLHYLSEFSRVTIRQFARFL
jgi:hypothetical protein